MLPNSNFLKKYSLYQIVKKCMKEREDKGGLEGCGWTTSIGGHGCSLTTFSMQLMALPDGEVWWVKHPIMHPNDYLSQHMNE